MYGPKINYLKFDYYNVVKINNKHIVKKLKNISQIFYQANLKANKAYRPIVPKNVKPTHFRQRATPNINVCFNGT